MDSEERGHTLNPRSHTDLKPLNSKGDVRRFLEGIRKDFLSTVDVRESGLEDDLIQNGVLKSDSDVESLHRYPTRKDVARHLWILLTKIDYNIFIAKALPVLCEKFYHIIPGEFWKTPSDTFDIPDTSTTGEATGSAAHSDCVRCAVKRRVRQKAMMDLLLDCSFITYECYDEYFNKDRANQSATENWDSVFKHLDNADSKNIGTFHKQLEKLLRDYSLAVPDNLQEIIWSGLPCTCPSVPQFNRTDERPSSPCEREYCWEYYGNLRRGSEVSTDPSVYPETDQETDSCPSSVNSTWNSGTQSAGTRALFYLVAERNDSLVDCRDQNSAKVGEETASKTRFPTWPGPRRTVSSTLGEAFKILNSQQRSDRHANAPDGATCGQHAASNTDTTDSGLPGKVGAGRAGKDVAIQTDSLYKTFRIKRHRRRKNRPPLIRTEEFLQMMAAPPARHDDVSISHRAESLSAREEVAYPQCSFHPDSMTEDETVSKLPAEFQDEEDFGHSLLDSTNDSLAMESDSSSLDDTSSTDCSSSEASRRPAEIATEETTGLEELCDFMGTFDSEGALVGHLSLAEQRANISRGVGQLTVAICQQLKGDLQSTFARFDEMRRGQLALSPRIDCLSSRCLTELCTTVRESCFSLVLGLQACLLWDTSLAVLGTRACPTEQDEIGRGARQRLKKVVEDIVRKIKDVEEEVPRATPGSLPEGFVEELSHLKTVLSIS